MDLLTGNLKWQNSKQFLNVNIMKSKFLALNFKDLAKGLLTAIITAISAYLYEVIQAGDLNGIDWKFVGTTAVIAAIGYLTKNMLTNSEGEPLKPESETIYKP